MNAMTGNGWMVRLRTRWWWLLVAGALGLLVALVQLNLSTYDYLAQYRVTPVRAEASGVPAGISSIAAVAGVNLGRGDAARPFTLYLQMLKSREVAGDLVRNEALLRGAFPAQWDAARGVWREPASRTRWLRQLIQGLAGAPIATWHKPGAAEMQTYLERELTVADDQRNAIARVSLAAPDPAFAMAILKAAHESADLRLRQRALARTKTAVTYLTETLPTVTVAEHREVLAQALGEQERVRMMAAASAAFAAEPLGSVTVSANPVTPNPFVNIAAIVGLFLVLGVAAVLKVKFPFRSAMV